MRGTHAVAFVSRVLDLALLVGMSDAHDSKGVRFAKDIGFFETLRQMEAVESKNERLSRQFDVADKSQHAYMCEAAYIKCAKPPQQSEHTGTKDPVHANVHWAHPEEPVSRQ